MCRLQCVYLIVRVERLLPKMKMWGLLGYICYRACSEACLRNENVGSRVLVPSACVCASREIIGILDVI